jgi:hypothetical protein
MKAVAMSATRPVASTDKTKNLDVPVAQRLQPIPASPDPTR